MAQVNFPSSPVQGQTYTQNGITWIFKDGGWELDCAPSSLISESFETVSKNLASVRATLNYIGDDLVQINYANGIRKSLNYTLGNLTSIVLSGTTPAGIDLSKTLSYTGDNLTGIIYS